MGLTNPTGDLPKAERSSLIRVMTEPNIGDDRLVPKNVNWVRLLYISRKAPFAETSARRAVKFVSLATTGFFLSFLVVYLR